MKKLKKMWEENRVMLVLGIIICICVLAIGIVTIRYFLGTGKSAYGDRLEGISEVPLDNSFLEEVKTKVQEEASILSVNLVVKGRIVYVDLQVEPSITITEAESKAFLVLECFEDKYLNFYDFQFILKQDASENSSGFIIMGARNVNGNGLVWNNNTEIKEDTTGE